MRQRSVPEVLCHHAATIERPATAKRRLGLKRSAKFPIRIARPIEKSFAVKQVFFLHGLSDRRANAVADPSLSFGHTNTQKFIPSSLACNNGNNQFIVGHRDRLAL